ncbi:MAG: hypothetical protein IT373_05275 [Polyangiaceae bacterium]|nr:hypothetical protein [Polyangiaceae bacterium]
MGGPLEEQDREQREEALAEALVAEALEPYTRLLAAELLDEVRHCLLDKLLVHPDGRRMLRRALPDPVVGSSGEVARRGAAGQASEEAERRRGGGEGKT